MDLQSQSKPTFVTYVYMCLPVSLFVSMLSLLCLFVCLLVFPSLFVCFLFFFFFFLCVCVWSLSMLHVGDEACTLLSSHKQKGHWSVDFRGLAPSWSPLFPTLSFRTITSCFPKLGLFFVPYFRTHLLGVDMSTFLYLAFGHFFWVRTCIHFHYVLIYYAWYILKRFFMHFGWWTSMIRWQALPNHECFLTLECEYTFNAYVVDACPYFIGCMIHHVCYCAYPC